MVNPRTVNMGIIVPLTGADVDLWGEQDVNPNMVALDGLIGGVQSIAVSNAPVTLTAPAGFSATPSPGPTQAQNKVLRFTGPLTGNVRVTLPLPGEYIIDNATGLSNFYLSFQGVIATEVIAVPPGVRTNIYNDGANVRFLSLSQPGEMRLFAGLSVIPGWVNACTVKPFLLADGSIYNISDFPVMGGIFGSTFGGNGITTFAVPDMQGRVPLAYDGTGARITVAQSGLNGQAMGASLDLQSVTLQTSQIPQHSHGVTDPGHTHGTTRPLWGNPISGSSADGGNAFPMAGSLINSAVTGITINNAGGGGSHSNVQPSIVTGIWVVKT